ncbi:hypothetical protein [Reyranella sp.]|uniref:hypothetical protein n=1 Tax=Reyranella sp. TaxID=1929291 RepID=UPI003C7EAF6A
MADADKRHVPFALARALTWTAKDAQGVVQDDLPNRYTLRNNWVKNGIRIVPAKKDEPQAVVGSLEPFMKRQEEGGTKKARDHSRVAVPVNARRNKRNMISKGQRPAALKGKPKIFMVTKGAGSGILRRVGKARYPLQLLYWLKRGVQVKPSFGFQANTSTTVKDRFGPNFVESLAQAIAKG